MAKAFGEECNAKDWILHYGVSVITHYNQLLSSTIVTHTTDLKLFPKYFGFELAE